MKFLRLAHELTARANKITSYFPKKSAKHDKTIRNMSLLYKEISLMRFLGEDELLIVKYLRFHGGDYEQCRLLGCYAVWLL
jgi:hypothetical protein